MTKRLYRGYEVDIEFESGDVLIYKHGKLVHKAGSVVAAHKWIDKKESR